MTDEEIDNWFVALSDERFVEVPELEDGQEEVNERMATLYMRHNMMATLLVSVIRASQDLRCQLLDRELKNRRKEVDSSELDPLKVKLGRLTTLRRVAQVRTDQVRSAMKSLRAVARMMENMYAHTSTDVWLPRLQKKRRR